MLTFLFEKKPQNLVYKLTQRHTICNAHFSTFSIPLENHLYLFNNKAYHHESSKHWGQREEPRNFLQGGKHRLHPWDEESEWLGLLNSYLGS